MKSRQEKSRKTPRIAVVGLMNEQAHRLSKACGTIAEITSVDRRRPPGELPDADHVILMTKFIKHSWTKATAKGRAQKTVHLHSGGISTLIEQIETICA